MDASESLSNVKVLTKHIRKIVIRNFFFPVILFIAALVFFSLIPAGSLGSVKQVHGNEEIIDAYKNGAEFVHCSFDTLYYSNFDYYKGDDIAGYYYYSLEEDSCVFVLVPISSFPNGEKTDILRDYSATAMLVRKDDSFKSFLENFAADIGWNTSGLNSITASFSVDQVTGNTIAYYFIFFITIFVMIACAGLIVTEIVFLAKPVYHISLSRLKSFGRSRFDLDAIEEELQNDCRLHIESVYITSNFLIELGRFSLDVIPIENIVWFYHFSHYRHAFSIYAPLTFSLCVYTDPYHRYTLHRKSKDTVDKITEYFNEHYPEVITEFSDEMHERAEKQRKAKKSK